MNINEDSIKELQKKINEITEISKKYASMGYKKSDQINFRNPKDEIEEAFVKKANIKHFAFMFFITFIFLLCFIFTFIVDAKVIIKILLGIMTLVGAFFSIKTITTKELMIGKAIYKEKKRSNSGNGKRRTYMYFVTVIDEENKLIHSRIQVSKIEYEIISEGTNILISKGSGQGYIYE
ncbi:MAG: hypothetical protein J5970_04140 [Bacilli bacterium]|nr:hypothetical protein [Bacilli bacterium]